MARGGLAAAAVPSSGLEAQLLLAHVLNRGRGWLLAHPRHVPSDLERLIFGALVARRVRREPYAYLIGSRDWLDLTLAVDRNVLIPRPETEILAEAALAELRSRAAADPAHSPVSVDVGTGSGALAIAMARGVAGISTYATDSSGAALRVARRSAALLGVPGIAFLECDLLTCMPLPADLVVANLPYIPTADLAALEPELGYEPRAALDGGADGLEAIAALLRQAPAYLAPGGTLLLECGHDQAGRVIDLARSVWPDVAGSSFADLAGIARFVRLDLPRS